MASKRGSSVEVVLGIAASSWRKMFYGYAPFTFSPGVASDMPTITSVEDRRAWVAGLRRIMEHPQQLLADCVADYVMSLSAAYVASLVAVVVGAVQVIQAVSPLGALPAAG
jgi:hypothetical protein